MTFERATSTRRRIIRALIGCVLAVGTAYALVAGYRVGQPRADRPSSVDAAVVFSGGRGRLERALELVDEGIVDHLVVNHGRDPDGGPGEFGPVCDDPSVPVEVICLSAEPSTTLGEARAFARLAEEREWGSLVAVTSDYHLERARFVLSRCFGGETHGDFDPSTRRLARSAREAVELMVTWITRRGC